MAPISQHAAPIPTTTQLFKEAYRFLIRYRYPVLSSTALTTVFSSRILEALPLNTLASKLISIGIGQFWLPLLLSFLLANKAQVAFSSKTSLFSSCQFYFPFLGITLLRLAAGVLCLVPVCLLTTCFNKALLPLPSGKVGMLLLAALIGLLSLLAAAYVLLRLALAHAFFGLRRLGIFSALRSSWIASTSCWSQLLLLALFSALILLTTIGTLLRILTSLMPEETLIKVFENGFQGSPIPVPILASLLFTTFFLCQIGLTLMNACLFKLADSLNNQATLSGQL